MGKNISELHTILDKYYCKAVGGVHILPFYPSSADRGFAPMRYDKVDEAFGTFEDIDKLGEDYYLMFDFMVNHISAHSEYFQDFLKNKDNSPYKEMFIRYKEFWKNGEPTKEEVNLIYKRKPRAPYIEAEFSDGTTEKIWCTFKKLTLPLLLPFISTNLILSTKNMLMVFDQIISLTKGGPAQSTESISYLIYRNGMEGGQFGFQSANAVVFFILIVTISVVQLVITSKKEEQL